MALVFRNGRGKAAEMAAAFSDMIVDSGIRGYNGPDGGSPPRSKTPESSMTFTKFVSKGTDSGVNQGWRSSWLRNVVFEPEFQRWLGQQIESCPVDPRDTRRHRYIEFSSMPPANLHNFGSMTRQHLSPELFAKIKDVRTSSGYSISNAIQAGLLNPHDKIGLVLGDEESFDAFADVLTPIIEGYHSIDSLEYEFESNLNAEDLVFTQEQARSLRTSRVSDPVSPSCAFL